LTTPSGLAYNPAIERGGGFGLGQDKPTRLYAPHADE
jgi:hypothetical protein